MSWKRKIGWAAIVLGSLLVVAIVGGYFYLKSHSFERYALRKIAEQADAATGGRTSVGGMDFSLSTLTAHLYDITVHGTEGPDRPPLMQAERLTVGVKIVSALHQQVSLRELLIDHPVVYVQVDSEGKSNFPTPPASQSTSHTSVFDLAVGHFQLADGELSYNDRKTPMSADVYDLATDIRFASLERKYSGSVSYKSGHVQYADRAPLEHSVELKFSATPQALDLESATLKVGSSEVALQAKVSEYANPTVDGKYAILIGLEDLAKLTPEAKGQGQVLMSGELHYAATAGKPVLQALTVTGTLAGDPLAVTASGRRVELRKLSGHYRLADGNLRVSNVSVESLGGLIRASAEMNGLDATPQTNIQASLQDISLRALQSVSGTQIKGASLSGVVSGKAEASWKGSVNNLEAHSDLLFQAKAAKQSNASAAEIPVNGAVHASYHGRNQNVELHDTVLRVPSANLTAQGIIGNHSSLQIRVVADDLQQLAKLISSFQPGEATPFAVSGRATVNAMVQGSLKTPAVSAQLQAQNLQVRGSEWSSAGLSLTANPSQLVVQNGSLVNSHQGRVSFSTSINLRNWSYDPSDRIQARVDAHELRITDLQEMANQHLPVSGDLTARLTFDGSQLDPAGSGDVDVTKATAYEESFDRLVTTLRAGSGSISANAFLSAKAGTIHSDVSYTPKTRAYKVKVDAPSIVLEKFETLRARNSGLAGTVSAVVSGEGTVDDPQLLATVQIPELHIRDKSIREMKAEARVAQHRLELDADSKVSEVLIHAHGQMALDGNYDAEAKVDTGTIPLEAIMAAFASSAPAGFQGQTELHATLRGPLKDKTRVEAHLSIPVFKASYQSLQLGIVDPIKVDYANSIITIQRAEVQGSGTSLRVEGKVPLAGNTPPTLTAKGSVDLRILKILAPDLTSSGNLALDVRTTGTAAKPEIQGSVQLKNVAVTTPDAPVGIERLNGTLDLTSDRIQVTQLAGQMGGGQVNFGGSIIYRPSLQFNLAVQSDGVRLLYPDGLRSLLNINLALRGTASASTLTGRVLINSLNFTSDFDLAKFGDQFSTSGTVSQPGFADTIRLAIAVQSENLSATSSQISLGGRAALQVGGTAANPVITGRTTLTSGELFYRNVRYQLQRGIITFDNPNVTHPVLNVAVITTIEQYNLTLTLRGPLEKLTTSYVSDPPLATADVINLVARGKTTQEQAASSQSTDSMIASQAAGQLSSSVQKLAGISSLQIDPTIGGNNKNPSARIAIQQRVTKNFLFTFSTDVSEPGSEIIQGEYQINRRWSVSVARDQLGGVSVDGKYHKRF